MLLLTNFTGNALFTEPKILHVFCIRNKNIRNVRLKSGKNKKHLRNTNRLNFKSKFEKTTFTRNASMNLEAKYKLSNKTQNFINKIRNINTNALFLSHSCLIWVVVIVGNFKNFKKHLRLNLTKY